MTSYTSCTNPDLRERLCQHPFSKEGVIHHWINHQWVPGSSGETFEKMNPATGECIYHVASGTKEDIHHAVTQAKSAFETGPWARMPLIERAEVLERISDLILEHKDLLAMAETLDTGKPLREALEGDIPRSAWNFKFFAQYAASVEDVCYTVNTNERHIAVREPLGVVGLITPWNLPLYLATWKIAPALMMGNAVILKPAEWTPTTAAMLGVITEAAGLPPGILNIVHGYGPGKAGEALTTHPNVSAISFTGETSTGKAIMANAAQTLKKVSFELGGKGANILFADTNLDEAIPTVVRSAFRNQGEICLAGSRLFVQEPLIETVTKAVCDHVASLRVGPPTEMTTDMGAIIHPEHLAKIERYLEIGKVDGQHLMGGHRVESLPNGNFIHPAVFLMKDHTSALCREEVFGPVLPIIPFQTEEEVIEMANDTPYGLSMGVWSQNLDRCHRVSQQLKAGIVWINCWFARDLRTPFGGHKNSGIGREGGRFSLDFFSETKTICTRYH